MTPYTMPNAVSGKSAPIPDNERRRSPRDRIVGDLWMLDNHTSTILRCSCVDLSEHGMRLRAPIGYGVRAGQQYELCSHRPGQSAPPGLGLMISRRATVVWTNVLPEEHDGEIEIGVELVPRRMASVHTPRAGRFRTAVAHA